MMVPLCSLVASGCEVIMKPFQCCVLPCFVVEERREGKGESESGYVERLKSELLRLKFHEKNNDLYQFRQVKEGEREREREIKILPQIAVQ